MAATRTTCHNRGPHVLKDLPLGNWYCSELEDQLNELNIAFSSKDKVTALIKKLEHARFHPSYLLGIHNHRKQRVRNEELQGRDHQVVDELSQAFRW